MIHDTYRTYLPTWFCARRDKAETRAHEQANNIFAFAFTIYGGGGGDCYLEKDDPSSREDRYREINRAII